MEYSDLEGVTNVSQFVSRSFVTRDFFEEWDKITPKFSSENLKN